MTVPLPDSFSRFLPLVAGHDEIFKKKKTVSAPKKCKVSRSQSVPIQEKHVCSGERIRQIVYLKFCQIANVSKRPPVVY